MTTTPTTTPTRRPTKTSTKPTSKPATQRATEPATKPATKPDAKPAITAATSPTTAAVGPDVAAPLDALLVEAALGPIRRFAPGLSTARLLSSLATRPTLTARRLGSLTAGLGQIALGTSTITPSRRDRRFVDEAWTTNPVLRRVVQSYLAAGQTAERLVADADLDWRDDQRARFLVENLVEALAPSNVPLLNPASAKAVIDTGGMNVVRGATAFVKDMASAPRIPQMVDGTPFELGRTIAVTPGAVVLRTEVFELIRYTPQTPQVRAMPVLFVPPTINKFYAIDLAPGRSLVEYLVGQGQQVFVMSWRNPQAVHADWDTDTYVQSVLEAMDAAERLTESDQVALTGICAGGILASLTAAYLAATGQQDRLAAFTLLVTVLDSERSGVTAAFAGPRTAELAKQVSRRKGYLDGRALAEIFAWLRPGDLVWNYWVNNYLLGKKPPAFDILFWNADTTRLPAALHGDFIDIAAENRLTRPGGHTTLGVPVDLSQVTTDAYLVAGITDHITPWQNCYRSTQLLGGDARFVLSTSGHIAALVNPADNPKASFQTGKDNPADPQAWLRGAQSHEGSWWRDYDAWLAERCGVLVDAPARPGGHGLEPLADAPGTYVFET
jgi:polyhydroxyalkanoate synthase subunit PhaC